jgi:hypothetical protein
MENCSMDTMLAYQQEFVEEGLETIMIGKTAVKGLDSGEGRDPRQHSGVRIKEAEAAQGQEKIFVWKKDLDEGGV